jgi:hypothetical protein
MNHQKQIDEAMKRLDSDPALAADFDNLRRTQYPGKNRREAAALGLVALEAKRKSTAATSTAKTLRTVASTAATTFRKAVATITKSHTDKRVGDLPLDQWAFGHLASAAQAGDQLAVAEINRRGFEINANQTFRKKN